MSGAAETGRADALRDEAAPCALLAAVARGRIDDVRVLLAGGASANVRDETRNETPLMAAAAAGATDIVALLLAYDALIDAKDDDGNTALWQAVSHGHAATVAALVAGGADVNRPDGDGCTPLMWIAGYGATEMLVPIATATANLSLANEAVQAALDIARSRGKADFAQGLEDIVAARATAAEKAAQQLAAASAARAMHATAAGNQAHLKKGAPKVKL